MNSPIIEIKNLCKRFTESQLPALCEVNATLLQGQLIGLVGPDGSGKTTLLRHLAGLLKATSGSLKVIGLDPIKEGNTLHENIGYMPQKFGLYEDLSVIQNLNLYANLHGLDPLSKKQAFEKLLHFTELGPFTERLAKNLSGGMKQKLGLACVLLKKPKLLLLDEPSVGVDPISRRELWKMVKTLISEEITVIWSTCYLDEAEKCNTVLLLNEGKLIYQGSPKQYTRKVDEKVLLIPTSPEKKRGLLIELSNEPSIIDCSVQGDSLRIVVKESANASKLINQYGGGFTSPKFEDAFIYSLSSNITQSHLAERMEIQSYDSKEILIEADHLTKKFNEFTAVHNISFTVNKGEIFGLLGPNGAGKSTTFKMLCGLLTPSEGSSSVMSLSMQKAPSVARSQIGYMAQKFSLYGDLTCLENLEFFAGIYPVEKKERTQVIQNMIDTFDLSSFLSTCTKDLSLGFKQRLALACCLMHKPKVLFLDEPTSGVDPITRREFWGHINSLVKNGITIMITTHFMDEAEYCDRIALIDNGKLIMIGSPDQLKQAAATKENRWPTLEDAFIFLSLKQGGEK